MPTRTPFIGGNWKMNTDLASGAALADALATSLDGIAGSKVDVVVCPPFPYLPKIGGILREKNPGILLGAQSCWHQPDGAFTGEVSLAMLKDCGVQVVLTGHSERRHVIGESDELVGEKTRAVLEAGLRCILCIGETLEQREANQTDEVNERQLRAGLAGIPADHMQRLTVAYEPVWAIGTGKTASPDDAQNAHLHIRGLIGILYGPEVAAATRIQYGGSVKPGNAAELFARPDIDGGLIGGAALKADDFTAIVRAAV